MNSRDLLREFEPDFENLCRISDLIGHYLNFNPYIMENKKKC